MRGAVDVGSHRRNGTQRRAVVPCEEVGRQVHLLNLASLGNRTRGSPTDAVVFRIKDEVLARSSPMCLYVTVAFSARGKDYATKYAFTQLNPEMRVLPL